MLLTARVTSHPSERRELSQALTAWAAATRLAPGALAANVYEDTEAPAVFGLVAEWDGPEALESHIRSEGFGVLLGALDVLAGPARLAIARTDDDSASEALRTIRRLRKEIGGENT